MCLAIPMKVIQCENSTAKVEVGGTQRTVRLDLLAQSPQIGDYVIVHAGFAIQVIDEQEARITLDYLKEMFADELETSN